METKARDTAAVAVAVALVPLHLRCAFADTVTLHLGHRGQNGEHQTAELVDQPSVSPSPRSDPLHRLPDWRVTLPLAQSCPPMWRAHSERRDVQGPCDAERPLSDAWRQEHRPAHGGGVGADAAGQYAAWELLGGKPAVDAIHSRVVRGSACHATTATSVNQIVRLPRWRRPAS